MIASDLEIRESVTFEEQRDAHEFASAVAELKEGLSSDLEKAVLPVLSEIEKDPKKRLELREGIAMLKKVIDTALVTERRKAVFIQARLDEDLVDAAIGQAFKAHVASQNQRKPPAKVVSPWRSGPQEESKSPKSK